MIANIGPTNGCFEDTHNTLKYANRAKNIKTVVQRNVVNVEYHVSKYTQIIASLKVEITDLKG
jgi:kinesin family protein 18/19